MALREKVLNVTYSVRIILVEQAAASSGPTRSSISQNGIILPLVHRRTQSYEPAQTHTQPGIASCVDDVMSPFLPVIRIAKGKWDYGTLVVCAREAGVM